MPKKRSPILQKVINFLKISLVLAKMGKPMIPNLIFLKKSRKLKKFKLLKHYNYNFVEEYEFSPSNTPLIHYYRKPFKKRSRSDVYSMFFSCRCLGSLRGDGGDGDYPLEALQPATEDAVVGELLELSDSGVDGEDSVDQRAERFIERFYEEMKMQRQESALQLNEVLDIAC
ncbi:hypothetical protein L1049_007056 [Liquidambar formosana]|uniref:Cotton fiber protein n=1 Tax=Liquidambar formosana TaxID=63359 RepID=A0AAP0RGN8_LIQFO